MQLKQIEISSIEYPFLLKNIYNPPEKLYVYGNTENLRRKCITIIGTRNCTFYGKRITKKIIEKYAKNNYVIVSTLESGINITAIEETINLKARCIAVLGTAINKIYPKENIEVARRILRTNGTIISEFNINEKTTKKSFWLRNRILSGISNSLIIVEAGEKSGTLITANYALEQGRNVYSVIGRVDSKQSIGTNNLVKEGAIPIIFN